MPDYSVEDMFDLIEVLTAEARVEASKWGNRSRQAGNSSQRDRMQGVKTLQNIVNDINEKLGKLRSQLSKMKQ